MQEVDSAALHAVSKSLGLSTPGGQRTDFDDENLQQVLDVGPLIRRGRALGARGGAFSAYVVNTHPAADTQTTNLDVYKLATPTQGAGWPSPVPEGYDAWLVGSQALQSGAIMTAAMLRIVYPSESQIYGAAGPMNMVLRTYLTTVLASVTIGSVLYGRSIGDGQIGRTHAIRIPRGATVTWQSISNAAGDISAILQLGLFPAGLGQDLIAPPR